MEPDWENLEALALDLILDKLVERIDHVWFGAVCKNWCSIAKLSHQNHQVKSNVLPMLMIPIKRKSRTKGSLYGIPTDRVYPFQLSILYNKRCCGSTHGWLATVDGDDVITLLNPFKNVAPISLPFIDCVWRHRDFYECNIHKVTLSADPITSPNNYVIVAIYSYRCCLAFIRAGQTFWTYVDTNYFCFNDVTFYNGLVYAVDRWKSIVSFNLCYLDDPYHFEEITPSVVLQGGYHETYSPRTYLVKSLEGDLWMVRRFLAFQNIGDDDVYAYSEGTKSFHVYKLELDPQSGKLQQMLKLEDLGDNVLFVGDNDSIFVSASYFSSCLRKDSIYYADDFNDDAPQPYPLGPFDLGIYNVKDESFGHHCPYKPSFRRMPPPFWVVPPFQWD